MSDCKLDLTAFRVGLEHKRRASKRAFPEILNKAGRDISLRAIQFTDAANRATIRAELNSGLALKLVQSKRFAHRLPRKLQGFPGGKHKRAEIDAAARQLVRLRANSANNIRAGWIMPARVFGGALNRKVSGLGNTGKGYGGKARESSLLAFGVNLANGAAKVGLGPLQRAVNFVGNDMAGYAPRLLTSATR